MSENEPPVDSGPSVQGDPDWHGDLRYTRLFDLADEPAAPKIVGPFGAAEGSTNFFGDGGSGKSILVLTLLASVAAKRELIAGMAPTIEGPVGWLDFEGRRRPTRQRAERLLGGPAPIIYIPCYGAFWDEQERIKRIAEVEGMVAYGVDSAGYAMGGKFSAKDDEPARYFKEAVTDIGLPAFVVAHVARDASERSKPFGSAFWHNGSVQTWAVEKVAMPGHVIRLTNHKDNDGPEVAPVWLEIEWGDRIVLRNVKAALGDNDLIRAVQTIGPATTSGIREWLSNNGWIVSPGTLADRLAKLAASGQIGRSGSTRNTRWLRVSPEASNGAPNASGPSSDSSPNGRRNGSRMGRERADGGAE